MNSNQQKKQKMNKSIGIAVGLLIALTLIITIIAFTVSKREGKKPPTITTAPKTTTSSTSTTAQITPPPSGTQGTPEIPNNPTGVEEPLFLCPVTDCSIVKNYSSDIPVFSLTMEDYRLHTGVDIGGEIGSDVLAAADGEVTKVYYDVLMGQSVEITHDGGYVTVYKNLGTSIPEGIEVGATVSAGDTIGYVGDTALIEISEEPHIHFEMLKDEKSINPAEKVNFPQNNPETDYED